MGKSCSPWVNSPGLWVAFLLPSRQICSHLSTFRSDLWFSGYLAHKPLLSRWFENRFLDTCPHLHCSSPMFSSVLRHLFHLTCLISSGSIATIQKSSWSVGHRMKSFINVGYSWGHRQVLSTTQNSSTAICVLTYKSKYVVSGKLSFCISKMEMTTTPASHI